MELLKELIPRPQIGMLVNPSNPIRKFYRETHRRRPASRVCTSLLEAEH